MLKTHFESNILSENALHEIQFGHIERPAHASHPFASDRYECCQQHYSALCEANRGFAILNNGIYGLSTDRGEMALTLLRAPLVPDETADRGRHEFTYSLYPFAAEFAKSGVVQEGYRLNQPIQVFKAGCQETAGISCESENGILETVKPAEDGNGLILRLYQSVHANGTATIHFPFEVRAYFSSMDESICSDWIAEGRSVSVRLHPFEIQTLRCLQIPEA